MYNILVCELQVNIPHTLRFHDLRILLVLRTVNSCESFSQYGCHGFTLSFWTNSIGHGKVMTLAFLLSIIVRCSVGTKNPYERWEGNNKKGESWHLRYITAVHTHNLIQFKACFHLENMPKFTIISHLWEMHPSVKINATKDATTAGLWGSPCITPVVLGTTYG